MDTCPLIWEGYRLRIPCRFWHRNINSGVQMYLWIVNINTLYSLATERACVKPAGKRGSCMDSGYICNVTTQDNLHTGISYCDMALIFCNLVCIILPQGTVTLHHQLSTFFILLRLQCFSCPHSTFYLPNNMSGSPVNLLAQQALRSCQKKSNI